MAEQQSQPPPPPPPPRQPPPPARNATEEAGGAPIPVVAVLGWTPRARTPQLARRHPPARQQAVPPPPPDIPPRGDPHVLPPAHAQPPPPPSSSHLHPFDAHRHMPRHPPPMMPPPPLPPPPTPSSMLAMQLPQAAIHAEGGAAQDWPGAGGRCVAAASATPSWLSGAYSARSAPANGVFGYSGGSADFGNRNTGANGGVGWNSPPTRAGSGNDGRSGGGGDAGGSSGPNGYRAGGADGSAGGRDHNAATVAENHAARCKRRLEALEATAKGEALVPELKLLMETLRVPMLNKQAVVLRGIRKEKWAARARTRSAMADLRKLEREFMKIDAHATHIDSKISRLRSYSEYIENGWKDEAETAGTAGLANGAVDAVKGQSSPPVQVASDEAGHPPSEVTPMELDRIGAS